MPKLDQPDGPERIMGNRPMTFLEFVATRLMGPAISGTCWKCPICDGGGLSFSIRPPLGNYPIKFKCFRCGSWGDEADLLRHFYPGEKYPQQLVRLDQYRQDFEAELKLARDARPAATFSFPGITGMEAPRVDRKAVATAWANLSREEIDLLLAARTLMMEKAAGVDFNSLTDYASGFDNWVKLFNDQHLEECQDPDCGDYVCRAERGLPPLTREDIEAEQEADQERQRERNQVLHEQAAEYLRGRRFKHHPANLNEPGRNGGDHAEDHRNGRA